MIDADYLTPEHELQQLMRKHELTLSEDRVRHSHRYKVIYSERDDWDETPDAYDHYTGYGPTYEQARARAYGQSAAAERHNQYLEGLEAGS